MVHIHHIRKVWSKDKDKFRDHLLRLDSTSLKMRFGMGVSRHSIEAYADSFNDDESTVLYGYFKNGVMHASAVLHKLHDSWSPDAEAAFSVEEDYQNLGIGTELMGKIIASARNRHVHRLHMSCLSENARMRRIAAKYNAYLDFECGEVLGEIHPRDADYLSRFEEMMDDGKSLVMGVLDLGNRVGKAA